MSVMRRYVSAILLIVASVPGTSAAFAEGTQGRVSDRDFDATVQQLQWAFGGYGLSIVVAMDYQRILKKTTVATRRAILFEVSRREWIKQLLAEDPSLGGILPVRVYVYEDAHDVTRVQVATKTEALVEHPSEAVRRFGHQLQRKLAQIVASAVSARPHDGDLRFPVLSEGHASPSDAAREDGRKLIEY